jgi:hypothetical protein
MKYNNTDDYKYIRYLILENSDLTIEELKNNLKHNEYSWVLNLLITIKKQWILNGNKEINFPKFYYTEIIDDVIKDIIN